MAEFRTMVITNKGQALIAKMLAGKGNIEFTKISLSETAYSDSQILTLISINGVKQTTGISKVTKTSDAAVQVEGAVTNADLNTGYYIRTIALHAKDPDDGEIVYAACGASTAGWMPPFNGVSTSGAFLKLVTTVQNASNVSITVDPAAVATIGDINNLQSQINNLQAFVGYTDDDIYGVEVDFVNKKFTRLAGAVNRAAGENFDSINAFGGRKRCNLTDDGKVVAYYGDTGFSETGILTSAITIGEGETATTYAAGTKVQVMVEQPKFYYKVVPLELEKVEGGKGFHMRKARYYVSDTIKAGFKLHPAFIKDGKEKNFIYLSAYEGSVYDVGSDIVLSYQRTANNQSSTPDVNAGLTIVYHNFNDYITIELLKQKIEGGILTLPSGNSCNVEDIILKPSIITANNIGQAIAEVNTDGYITYLLEVYDIDDPEIPTSFENKVLYNTSNYLMNDEQITNFDNDMLSSIANTKPASGLNQNLTRANVRKLCSNRGSGWSQETVQAASATELLFLVEYASFDVQSKIGIGVTNKTDDSTSSMAEITGVTSTLGNKSGQVVNTNGYSVVSYRGEENPFGNIWKWIDGINIYNYGEGSVYIADYGFADNTKDAPYQDAKITITGTSGYVSAFAYNEDFDWLFIASETVGNNKLPVGDYFYQNKAYSGYTVAILGGSWDGGSYAGSFCWHITTTSSNRHQNVGGRLLYIPDETDAPAA